MSGLISFHANDALRTEFVVDPSFGYFTFTKIKPDGDTKGTLVAHWYPGNRPLASAVSILEPGELVLETLTKLRGVARITSERAG